MGGGDVLGLGMINVHDVRTKMSVKPLQNQCVVISKKKVPLCSHIRGLAPEAMLALYLIGPRKVSVHCLGSWERTVSHFHHDGAGVAGACWPWQSAAVYMALLLYLHVSGQRSGPRCVDGGKGAVI